MAPSMASAVASFAVLAVAGAVGPSCAESVDPMCGLSLLQQRVFMFNEREQSRGSFASHGTSSRGIVRLLDFTKAVVIVNNLGGQGPWMTGARGEKMPEEIRIGNLVVDQKLDLLITAAEGYQAHNASRNGILGGNGQINAKSGTTVTLNFTFVEAGTYTPHEMPLFYITFSDLDERHGGTEKEMIAVDGFFKFYTNDDLAIVGKDTVAPAFESVDYGNYADNDMHPDTPQALQLTHAVTFQFIDKATFRATFIVTRDGDDIKGRNILFSGISQLVFCQEPSTYLDFTTSTVVHNNLGTSGPSQGDPAEMRYANIGTFGGEAIDLLVTAEGTYKPWNVSQNGLNGDFGIINLFSGDTKDDSEVDLLFRIVKAGTYTNVTLDAFAFMFFDFDTGLHEQQIEYVELMPAQPGFAGGTGYASYIATDTTELNITQRVDGRKRFEATKHGTAADNPKTSQMLARESADRSVAFTFRKTSEFRMIFGITPNGFNTGRNLMFAGQDMYLMCD